MLARLSLAWRVIRGLSEASKPTVTREQYDEMRAFLRQHVLELQTQNRELYRALIEERSPGTLARINPQPKAPRVVEIKEPDPEMPFP